MKKRAILLKDGEKSTAPIYVSAAEMAYALLTHLKPECNWSVKYVDLDPEPDDDPVDEEIERVKAEIAALKVAGPRRMPAPPKDET